MQRGHDNLGGGKSFAVLQSHVVYRNATAVVDYGDRIVEMNRDFVVIGVIAVLIFYVCNWGRYFFRGHSAPWKMPVRARRLGRRYQGARRPQTIEIPAS